MNIRSKLRTCVIQAGALVRADSLARLLLRKPEGIVVATHETPSRLEKQFRVQLEWAARRFTITTLEGFSELWKEGQPRSSVEKPLLLFTFDDGRESNYSVAAPLLEAFGGRGVFFIVPEFAECVNEEKALAFYRARINPNSRMGNEQSEDWRPMTPAQIADLAARGHAIGNHTLTHERLAKLSPGKLEAEIGESSRKLQAWTRKPVEAFAWTFGWSEIDAAAWQAILKHHRFCFSPCAGAIDGYRDRPRLLWRREIEARYSEAEMRFSYSGLVDLWWATRRKRLRDMLRVTAQ